MRDKDITLDDSYKRRKKFEKLNQYSVGIALFEFPNHIKAAKVIFSADIVSYALSLAACLSSV